MITHTRIAMTNRSGGALSDDDCRKILAAAAVFLAQDFCPDWRIEVPELDFYPAGAAVPADAWQIAMVDQPPKGDEGIEAYHDDLNGVPDGFCFAGFLSAHGAAKFAGDGCIAQAWGHELAEALRNPRCNLVLQGPWTDPKGKKRNWRWAEVCDAAQGGKLVYRVDGDDVWMPAYALPNHEDLLAPAPYSKPEGLLRYPGHIPPEGYAGYPSDDGSDVDTVFGERVPPHIQELKAAHGRMVQAVRAAQRAAPPDSAPPTPANAA